MLKGFNMEKNALQAIYAQKTPMESSAIISLTNPFN